MGHWHDACYFEKQETQITMTRTALAAALCFLALGAFAAARAASVSPATVDLTGKFVDAGADIEALQVSEVGGIVVIRGRTLDKAKAEAAGRIAQSLGFARVANLVQITEPADDAAIQRRAERELAIHRSLDGCSFNIHSDRGIVRIAGRVHSELQKDVAVQLLRNVDGVREVHSSLTQ
jgi:osmotically-inducible protein OsmY